MIVLCSKNHIYLIIYTDILGNDINTLENVIIAFFIRKEIILPQATVFATVRDSTLK